MQKGKRWGTPLAAFCLPVGILLLVFLLVGIFPFGGATPLTGDLGGIYLPMMTGLRSSLQAGEGVLYSFSKSLGGEILSSYTTSGDLLFFPLLLLFPVRALPDVITVIYLVKLGLTGLFAFFLLRQVMGGESLLPVLLAAGYALSGYSTAFLQNMMWLNAVMLAPLVLLCLHRFEARRWRIAYCLLLALAIFANFYTGYMLCLFSAMYFLYLLLRKKQQGGPKAVGLRVGRFAGYSILAAGLCAALLVQVVRSAGAAKGGLFALEGGLGRNFSLLQLPEVLVTGNFQPEYLAGWLPFLYCGYLAMLGAALYFCNRAIATRAKLVVAGVLVVFGLSFWLELPNLIWHGFKAPVWFSFRYSFLCILFLVVLAAESLGKIEGLPRFAIPIAGGLFALAVCFAVWRNRGLGLSRLLLTLTIIAATAVLLWLLREGKLRRVVPLLLAAVVAAELTAGAWQTQRNLEFRDRAAYQSQADSMQALLADVDDAYRLDTQWFYTLNDPLLYGYKGLSFFNSVQDDATLLTLRALGFVRNDSTMLGTGAGGTRAANRLLALRYRIGRETDAPPPTGFVPVAETGDVYLYEDAAAYPMVFAAGGAVLGVQLGADAVENLNTLWRALTGVAAPLLQSAGYEQTLVNLTATPDAVRPDVELYTVIDPAAASDIELRLVMPEDGALYLALHSADGIPVAPRVGGEALGSYGSADRSGLLPCGSYAAGQELTLQIGIGAGEIRIGDIALYVESDRVLEEAQQLLTAGTPEGLSIQNGLVSARVGAAAGDVLFTSIPYDAAWQANVNGKTVDIEVVSGLLMAIPLEAGINEVILRYRPAGLGLGIGISVGSALVLLALCLLPLCRKKRASSTVD